MTETGEERFAQKFTDHRLWLFVVILAAIGCLLRYIATLNNLWLDELISLHLAFSLRSVGHVFTAIHSDNNHYLNTLYLYLIGPQKFWPTYRYFSVACGVLTIPAGYWAAKIRSSSVGLLYAVVLAFSYPLIHFSSEARGYSTAVLAGVVAYGALARWTVTSGPTRTRWTACYAVASVFGLLAHLTFLPILFGFAIWSLLATIRMKPRAFGSWLLLHIPVGVLFLLLFWVDLRGIKALGSGVEVRGLPLLSRLLALSSGWPLRDLWTFWILGVPLFILAAAAIYRLYRTDDSSWLFFAFTTFFPPLFLLLPLSLVSLRHLLVFLPFWYLIIAIAVQRFPRAVQLAGLGLFVIGNLFLYSQFLPVGRGQFTKAILFMDQNTSAPIITVSSDQDFRAGIELDFYQHILPPGRVRLVPNGQHTSEPSEWAIFHSEALAPPLLDKFVWGKMIATKVAYYGCSELSGQAWTIYHLTPIE